MSTPRRIDQITPGYYRYRLVRGGPWLPAIVSIEDGMVFVTEADRTLRVGISAKSYEDLVVSAVMDGAAFENNLLRVIWLGEPIQRGEYEHLIALMTWAREHQPSHPLNHPHRPIKLDTIPVNVVF